MPDVDDTEHDRQRVLDLLRSERGGATVALAADYLEAVGAAVGDAGTTWGITALPSRETAIRINAGAQEVVQVLLAGGVKVWVPDASGSLASSVGAEPFEGHQSSTDAGVRFATLEAAAAALEDDAFSAACAELFERVGGRRLPKSNWNNRVLSSVVAALLSGSEA